jgi:hypothetical protein
MYAAAQRFKGFEQVTAEFEVRSDGRAASAADQTVRRE